MLSTGRADDRRLARTGSKPERPRRDGRRTVRVARRPGRSAQVAAISDARQDLVADLARSADVDQQARGLAILGEQPTDAERERAQKVNRDNTAWLHSLGVEA